ncbi:MAG: molybdate ABC transporter substrate-binding protein [Notoacmeibacter sp.]|nr:molybdate ABC transporter substrate-binding protein [Notoacmeibacter sp.]
MKFRVRVLSLLFLLFSSIPSWAGGGVTVFVPASMKDAIGHAAMAFEQSTGTAVTVVAASSSVLAKQITAGAPADLFISANAAWMDWAEEQGAVLKETRADIASNALVIATPENRTGDPAALLASGRFAMGDPGHVPAGIYARQALEQLGLWESVKANAVFGENVRVSLELVRRGEVGAAIVYRSDLAVSPGLTAAFAFDQSAHDPILYPAALTVHGGEKATGFLAFLRGAEGQSILSDAGFAPPPGGAVR